MKTKFTLLVCLLAWSITALAQQRLPYQNPSLSSEERARDLCQRLTLEEKAKIMMDVSPAIQRLGIPAFQWWNETLHGVARNGTATVFPITMSMAASWDDALVRRAFSIASDEARAKANVASAIPNVYNAENSVMLALWQLKAVMGVDLDMNMDIAGTLGDYADHMFYDIHSQDDPSLDRNTTLRQLAIQAEMLAKTIRTQQYAYLPSGTAISSTWRTFPPATSGKPTCPPSRHWCRRAMWLR